MTRSSLLDPLRDNNFWLYDVAPIEAAAALPIFSPLSGFNSISAPEITVDTQQITEGNWPFSKTVVKGAAVNSLTLTRGVTWFNSDFWRWVMAAVQGNTGNVGLPIGGISYRRTLLLVHFFRNTPASTPALQLAMAAGLTTGLSTATGFSVAADAAGLVGGFAGAASAAQIASLQIAGGFSPQAIGVKIPARAFLLKSCVPTRYKTGSDYDATSGQVSIQELDVQPEMVEEISLAA